MSGFDYDKNFSEINFREEPEKYQVGRGEEGVLLVEPYKSEILPHWEFKTQDKAKKSAKKIYSKFLDYKENDDFVGMDMARKFLQMGYTRARRYANYKGGKKYKKNPQKADTEEEAKKRRENKLPKREDRFSNEKAKAADEFYEFYKKAKEDEYYEKLKKEHKEKYE
ncbi:MAG: DUF4385 family protein [Candidatus Magasanikbacteria bacterium]